MKNFFLLCVALIMSFQLIAQPRRISGTILDSKDKSAMIGANIMEKGTSNGTITDINGKFSLNVTSSNSILVISSIGYTTLEVNVGNNSVLNLEMDEDTELLEEVVVIGYGTMKKSDISGASVSVSEDAIKGSVITNLDQALQGRASGVSSVMTSGAPGSSSSIRIRGQATINANAEPLYVIDGVIIQGGGSSGASLGLGDALGNSPTSTISPLSTINPSDILSMEILKDASATAI